MFTLVIDARTLDRMRLPPDPARWGSAVRCLPHIGFHFIARASPSRQDSMSADCS